MIDSKWNNFKNFNFVLFLVVLMSLYRQGDGQSTASADIQSDKSSVIYEQSASGYPITVADTTKIIVDIISENTTWTKENSPYLISGDLLVDYGVTLTIEPGVTVLFNRGDDNQALPHTDAIDLEIYGELIAEGSESDSIMFKDIYSQKDAISWKRIGIGHGWQYPGRAFFKYVNFYNCSNVAIWPSNADTLVVENCYFVDCERVFQDEESTPTNMSIRYNKFENITFEVFSLFSASGTYRIHYNNFPDKTGHVIKVYGLADARFNYWGEQATSEMNEGGNPKNISVILDEWDGEGFGKVNYSYWLDAPWPVGKPVFPDTTIISGNITSDTTWTLAHSPYYIAQDLHIYAELTIENGVEVIVGPGHFEDEIPVFVAVFIDEGGELNINPEGDPVWFHATDMQIIPDQPDTTGWGGLIIDNNNTTVSNLRIENANTAIKATKPNFLISKVYIEKCFTGIFPTDKASGIIQYSTIISQSHRETGIQIGSFQGTGPYIINYNNIYTVTENQYNTNLQLYFYEDDVDARYNYWGERVLAEMNAGGNPKNISVILDSFDDPSFGTVDYSCWLDAPWPEGKPVCPDTTIITGNITSDTSWTLVHSPYYIPQDLHIYANLTIENGVEVIVGPGHFEGENPVLISVFIDEGGKLIISPDGDPVWFHTMDRDIIPDQIDTTGWFGLNIDESDITLQNLHIENANTGIKANRPDFDIRSVFIEKCFTGLLLGDNANGSVQFSTIISQSHREVGIEIAGNEGAGPYVVNYNNLYTVTDNQYNTNLRLYFYNDDVDARYNYWGERVLTEMNAGGNPKNISVIIDSFDDSSFGTVDYGYWLDAPWPEGKPVYPEGNSRDSLALVALFEHTNGTEWDNNTNWLAGSISEWNGIVMHNGRVSEINLSNNSLTGTLPADIGNLDSLNILNLHSNYISGTIPAELSQLSNLEILAIHSNDFVGEIPAQFGHLDKLHTLLLNNNEFTGMVPTGFQNMINLRIINLADNNFYDIPDVSLLPITELQIQNNKFTFEDIEPNVAVTGIVYAPQDSVGIKLDTTLYAGEALNLDIPVGGSANLYSWWRNGAETGDTTSVLDINPVTPLNDGDTYILEITSSVVPDLTLYTRPIVINVIGDIAAVSNIGTTYHAVTTAGLTAWINPNNLVTTVKFEYGETTEYGQNQPAAENPQHGDVFREISVDIDNLSENTTYHFRLVAENAAGIYTSTDYTFATNQYPSGFVPPPVTALPAKSAPVEYDISDYRVIGLPGDPDIPLQDIMTGEPDRQWIAYWDNGLISANSDDYYVKYDASSLFNFTRGKAFFVISMNTISIEQTIPTAGLTPKDEISIPLHSGWNLITNPFLENVSWQAVQAVNDISYRLFGYGSTGQYEDSTLVPYQGYHIHNTDGLTELIIPYPGRPYALGKVMNADWKVSLRIKGRVLDENIIHFGISPDAETGKDQTEYNVPRLFKKSKGAWLERPEWDKVQPRFASDYRPDIGDVQVWPIHSFVPVNEEISLGFTGIGQIPADFSVVLIDSKSLVSKNLRSDSTYVFVSNVSERQFEFVVGRQDAVEKKIHEIVPKETALESNYPNPFNPVTTIPVVIASNVYAELKVYNILGKLISTLHKGDLAMGRHHFQWDGQDTRGNVMPTGLYIIRLTAGKNSYSRKLVLLR